MGNEETEIGNGLETKPKTLKTFAQRAQYSPNVPSIRLTCPVFA